MVFETGLVLNISIPLIAFILFMIFAVGPKIIKFPLYYFYQLLSVSFTEKVNDGDVIWPENTDKTDAAPGDGEWDIFNFTLDKVGRATPHLERINFHSSVPLKERDYAKKVNRVVTGPPNPSSDYMFHYEWNPDRLTDQITGESGSIIKFHTIKHLPFKRPDEDFELEIEIRYKIPLEELGFLWSSEHIELQPIYKKLHVNIPNGNNNTS